VEISDKATEGKSYCSIGNCLRSMVQPEKAIECYTRVCYAWVGKCECVGGGRGGMSVWRSMCVCVWGGGGGGGFFFFL